MTHLIESQQPTASLGDDTPASPPADVWLGESAPEDFLREVVDTLAGFLRDEPGAGALKTGDAPPES